MKAAAVQLTSTADRDRNLQRDQSSVSILARKLWRRHLAFSTKHHLPRHALNPITAHHRIRKHRLSIRERQLNTPFIQVLNRNQLFSELRRSLWN